MLEYKVRQYTDPGKKKERGSLDNEDSKIVDKRKKVFVLADGIGGRRNGKFASEIATLSIKLNLDHLVYYLNKGTIEEEQIEAYLQNYVNEAHECIRNLRTNEDVKWGTTLDVCLVYNNRAYIAHVGDSRVYHMHGKELTQVTEDDSESVSKGDEKNPNTKLFDKRARLTKYLGMELEEGEKLDVRTHVIDLKKGDVILMATDGLTDVVSHDEIKSRLRRFNSYHNVAQELVKMANNPRKIARLYADYKDETYAQAVKKIGGKDNITVIAIKAY